MFDSSDDRQHEPTPQRRQQARQEGRVARSYDLAAVLGFCGALAVLWLLGRPLAESLVELTRRQLGEPPTFAADSDALCDTQLVRMWQVGRAVLPLLVAMCGIAVGVHVIQTGWLLLPRQVAMEAQRINPVDGWRRLFSSSNVWRLLLGISKVLLAASVAAVGLWTQCDAICGLAAMHANAVVYTLTGIMLRVVAQVAACLLLLGLVDYAYQRWHHERGLRMTNDELRQELRDS